MYNYLPWPSNMRTTDHVLAMRIEEGAAGYGIYVMLLELLRDSETRSLVLNPRNLAFAINEPDSALVERVIRQYSLFDIGEDNTFTSPWLESQMEEYDAKKRAASEAGKRGAAKRYGQDVGQKPTTTSDPIGTPCPPPLGSHGNIINNILSDKINQSKSKLLGLSYEGLTGEDLFNIARKDSGPVSTITRQWQQGKQRELDEQRGRDKHNLDTIMEVCDYFNLGDSCYSFLLRYTDLGRVGTAHMVDLVALYHRSKTEKFKPRFPAEYVIVKLLQS